MFAVGFVAGQAVFCLLAFTLGTFSSPDRTKNHPTAIALVAIAFGGALLATAVYVRFRGMESARSGGPNPRTEVLRSRLSNLHPPTALATGAVLGIGGPKRVGITIVATATIAEAGLGSARSFALAAVYVVVATLLVWVPVLLYLVWGPRAARWLTDGQHWVGLHKEPLTFYPSAVLGLVLVVDGVVTLLG
jgi:hypothetical protein